jgi:MFS family permease
MRLSRPLLLLYMAGFLRALGVGLLGVVLGVYLSRVGVSATRIGLIVGAGIAGMAVATATVSWAAPRIGCRLTLVVLSLLTALGGLALAAAPSLPVLLFLAFVGMINGTGTDRSAAFALEQAIIPGLVPDAGRTWALSRYNALLDGGGALGALGAALPMAIRSVAHVDWRTAYSDLFFAFAAFQAVLAYAYLFLPSQTDLLRTESPERVKSAMSPQSRRVVRKLAALFLIDSFGGGFLTDALVAYWFFHRFGLTERSLGAMFFVVHLLHAVSHLGAAWIAHRIGLVNTMVFTHQPSSVFLVAVPLASTPALAIALFLLRETFVEMDVPTRQSYVAALVQPHERPYASAMTNVTRTAGWAAASSLSGAVMQNLAFSAPLVLGGTLKIVYDILLYRGFRHLKPPEETLPTVSGVHEPSGRKSSGDTEQHSNTIHNTR